jgi:tRNA acetyltransferase TAN1
LEKAITNRFNLLASTYRHGEDYAEEELLAHLEEFGDPDPESEITRVSGIVIAKTILDPFEVTAKLKELVHDKPWEIRHLMRVIPIERVCHTDLESIGQATGSLAYKVKPGHTFRITVERRHSVLSSSDIIKKCADMIIGGKVDLKSPCWVVLVETIGGIAGVSILAHDNIFSSVIEKRRF